MEIFVILVIFVASLSILIMIVLMIVFRRDSVDL